jgi:hypothetical protein
MGFSFKSVFKAAVVAAAVATGVGFLATAGYLGAGVAASVAAAGGIVGYATAAAVMGALTAGVSMLLAETPKSFDLGEQIRGQLTTARAPAADARVVYGETRLGGNVVFIETTGSKNETMFQAMTLAGHEIDSIQTVYANDEALTLSLVGNAYTTTYKGNSSALSFNWLLGTDTQAALPFFSGTSASGYRFLGIATLGAKLVYNQDVFPQGIPNITVKLRGKKVYDPRTTTTAYSNNAALCIRDYLLDTTFGLGASASEIDEQSFEDAADICDEDVNLAAGGTEKRYTINGAFSSAEKPKDVLAKMLTACGGKLAYVGGKWTLRVAAYRSPTVTLTEDDIVGAVSLQTSQSRRDIFNAVKGTYSEPGTLYQPASFPPITNITYESQDGERIWKDVQFPFTTSAATCQRLAKIDLETARQQISFTMSGKLTAFALQPGDTVNVNFERYGWTNKVFEVYNWTFSVSDADSGPAPQVDLVLRETASGIYDWNAGEETQIDLAPNTTLPDPFDVTPPGIVITDELAIISEEVFTKLVVTVSGTNTFQDFYEVQARKSGDTDYTNLGQATGNRFELPNVEDGAGYEVRARSVNNFSVRSDYATGSHQVVGKTTPPADVTNFSMNIIGTEAHFTWTPVADLDLSHYKIRHSRLTTGATYAEAIDLIFRIARPGVSAVAPAMTGTYFIKAIDKLGNASINAAEIIAIIEDIKGLNAVETLTESPTFSGNKTECNVVDGELVLDTAADFDDISGLFDDAEGEFDAGGGTISTTGTYDFSQVVDLGAIYTSRVTAFIEVGRIDYVNTFDSAVGLFDSREGDFDGSPNAFDDTNVELQVSVTEDDPSGTPTWTDYRKFFVGDYKARGLRFRAILTSRDAQATPSVSSLSVTVDMPDRVTSGDDITSGTDAGGKVVNFSPAFKAVPALGIAAQNLTSGDYYEIVSKTASGFTIRFKNSGGTVVDRTFDYVARGYGELAA